VLIHPFLSRSDEILVENGFSLVSLSHSDYMLKSKIEYLTTTRYINIVDYINNQDSISIGMKLKEKCDHGFSSNYRYYNKIYSIYSKG
jgi:hypothetical protein